MKYSELQTGDLLIGHPTFGGRSYTQKIIRILGQKYEYEADGKKYISRIPGGKMSNERYEVIRDEKNLEL